MNAQKLLTDLAAVYSRHPLARARGMCLDLPPDPVVFLSDATLLRRVMGNMLKNALEASAAGETVTLGCQVVAERVEFRVHNPSSMPRPIQLQIFQRTVFDQGLGSRAGHLQHEAAERALSQGLGHVQHLARRGHHLPRQLPPDGANGRLTPARPGGDQDQRS